MKFLYISKWNISSCISSCTPGTKYCTLYCIVLYLWKDDIGSLKREKSFQAADVRFCKAFSRTCTRLFCETVGYTGLV